jgi:hypothetical protein
VLLQLKLLLQPAWVISYQQVCFHVGKHVCNGLHAALQPLQAVLLQPKFLLQPARRWANIRSDIMWANMCCNLRDSVSYISHVLLQLKLLLQPACRWQVRQV